MEGAVRPSISAMVLDLAPTGRTTEAYGILRVGQNIGWAVGPALGGYLATVIAYEELFILAPLASLIALGLVACFLHESHSPSHSGIAFSGLGGILRNPSFFYFALSAFFVFLVMGQMGSTLSIFTVQMLHFSEAQYGMLLTLNGIIVILFQFPAALWANHLPRAAALTLGSLCYATGYLAFSWVGSMGWAMLAMVIISTGEIILAPTTLATVGEMTGVDNRGRYMGLYGLAEMLGFSLGPVIGGLLLDYLGYDPLHIWGVVAGLALISAAGFQCWGRIKPGPQHLQ